MQPISYFKIFLGLIFGITKTPVHLVNIYLKFDIENVYALASFFKTVFSTQKEQLYCTNTLLRCIDDIYSDILSHVQERLSSGLCHMDVTSQLLLKTVANVNTLLICRTLHSRLKTRHVCRSLQNLECRNKLINIA